MKKVLFVALFLCSYSHADNWIPFDEAPAGAPPTITYVSDLSNENQTVLDIKIHGVWRGEVVDIGGQGQVFDTIKIPHGSLARAIGKPEVPSFPINIALLGQGNGLAIEQIESNQLVTLDNILLAPAQPYIEDTPKNGGVNDPLIPFEIDSTFYQQQDEPWPQGLGEVFNQITLRGSFRMQTVCPGFVQYNPAIGQMTVITNSRVVIQQPDFTNSPTTISRRLASTVFQYITNINQLIELQLLFINNDGLNGNYLIVTYADYVDNVWPLVQQKLERGYRVSFKYIADIGTNPTDIKTELESWFSGLETDVDAYCLFVGDDPDIPMHPDVIWNSIRPSDYWYSCVEDDVWASFGIGRLSVDSAQEVDEQIEKILAYEDDPPSSNSWYKKVHTTVHWNTSHGFTDSADAVEALNYAEGPLTFTRRTGTNTSDTVQDVINDIDSGQHFLLYFGHGSDQCWSSWTSTQNGLCRSDVDTLSNWNKTPIVFSAGCQTSSIHQRDDCHSEHWMETTERGVAYIGATRNYWRTPAGMLGKWILWLSYTSGCPNISYAIVYGQLATLCESNYDENAYRNLYETQLLGDPEMYIWTENPNPYIIEDFPSYLEVGEGFVHVRIVNSGLRAPAEGAIVALSMNGEPIGNAFADANGEVQIPVSLVETGTLTIRAWNDLENVLDTVVTVEVIEQDSCEGDINSDGYVNVEDLLVLIANWGDCDVNNPCEGDFDSDGAVSIDDLLVLIAQWGDC